MVHGNIAACQQGIPVWKEEPQSPTPTLRNEYTPNLPDEPAYGDLFPTEINFQVEQADKPLTLAPVAAQRFLPQIPQFAEELCRGRNGLTHS